MHIHYEDILNAVGKEPLWFDQNGVPRFDKFTPNLVSIYDDQAVLFKIACQNCGRIFTVAMTSGKFDKIKLSEAVLSHALHYGDPPNIRCCGSGPTMNCKDLQVLEFWDRSEFLSKWHRIPELEILLPEHEDYNGSRKPFNKTITSQDIIPIRNDMDKNNKEQNNGQESKKEG